MRRGEADPAAQNDAVEIYVSSTGNDEQNTGTKELPFATLAKAVDAAADGAAIYVMSDLTMTAPPVSDLLQSRKKLSF